jgi:stage III sporulation protein SpoIIIAA
LKNFNILPKGMKKAIKYIYQEAPLERLEEIKILINQAIEKRLNDPK